nr:uncharacterized protein LOC123774074 isoform X2 [Procambarus clarkii]
MMNQRKSALNHLVQTEGRKVMYEVTIRLYQGGTRRPDRYWHDLYGNNNNNQTFTKYFYSIQQTQLKSDYQPNDYDIKNAAKTFDNFSDEIVVALMWRPRCWPVATPIRKPLPSGRLLCLVQAENWHFLSGMTLCRRKGRV